MTTFFYKDQRTPIFLSPGDELRLSLDFPRFDETLRYEGRGAEANNYLAQSLYKYEFGPAGATPRPQDQFTATTTAAQVRQQADTFRQSRLGFLAAYAKAHPLTPLFRREATAHIDQQWALTLLEFPVKQRRLTHTAAVLPASYYDFLRILPPTTFEMHDRGLDDNTLVIRCMRAYGARLVPNGSLTLDPSEGERLYKVATADLPTSSRDLAMFLLIKEQAETHLPGALAAYQAFRVHNRDSSLAPPLRQMLVQQKAIQPGQMAPSFTLLDPTGKSVSLTDFKGKVIYLDFWGTWCAPCMAEMPASMALKQQFVGRDVVFVYISVNDPEDKWRRVLNSARLTGSNSVHLRSPNNYVPVAFNVQGYPTYMVIGRDGRMKLPSAPRPSAGKEVVTVLERALAETP